MSKLDGQGMNAHREARDKLEQLLGRFEIVPITRPIATTAADIITELRQHGRPIDDLHDVYIAATAMVEQLPVLTGNIDHFDRIEDIDVIDWQKF